jgi:hypothetical protein
MKWLKTILILLVGVFLGVVGHVVWQSSLNPVTSAPDVAQRTPDTPRASVTSGPRSMPESPEWQQAIRTAESHMGKFGGYYSLVRVILETPLEGETIRGDITKLKELRPEYYGGGGQFRDVQSGEFLFIQHINSARRRNGSDPLVLKSTTRGTNTVWVPVPLRDRLGIVGNVVMKKASGNDQ